MPPRKALRFGLGLLFFLSALFLWKRDNSPTPQRPPTQPPEAPPSAPSPSETAPLLGDALLEGYADPAGTVQNDLQLIQRVLMSVRTLVKTQDPGRMAVNEDVVDVLLGKNDHKKVFLSANHPAINDQGQLIDRWERPLFFHLEAADRLDVRSAGPDGQLFTRDDCHLHADGAFMPGEALTGPPSSEAYGR